MRHPVNTTRNNKKSILARTVQSLLSEEDRVTLMVSLMGWKQNFHEFTELDQKIFRLQQAEAIKKYVFFYEVICIRHSFTVKTKAIYAADCIIFQVLRAFLLLTKCFALVLRILPSCFGSLTVQTIVLFYVSQYLSYSSDSFLTHLVTLDLLLAYKGVSKKKKVGFFRVTQTPKLGQTLLEVCFSPPPTSSPLLFSFPCLFSYFLPSFLFSSCH